MEISARLAWVRISLMWVVESPFTLNDHMEALTPLGVARVLWQGCSSRLRLCKVCAKSSLEGSGPLGPWLPATPHKESGVKGPLPRTMA